MAVIWRRDPRDSPGDHWTIMEILTAYVRQNARWVAPPPRNGAASPSEAGEANGKPTDLRADIQACLTVIGRRIRSADRDEPRLWIYMRVICMGQS